MTAIFNILQNVFLNNGKKRKLQNLVSHSMHAKAKPAKIIIQRIKHFMVDMNIVSVLKLFNLKTIYIKHL